MKVKTCTRCGETKPLDQFPPVRRSEPEKLQTWCRACFSVANKRNYWKDPDSVRSRVARNSARRRAESQRNAIEYLITHPCIDCGERDILCLQFDHMADKKFDVSMMISTGVSWGRIAAEIAKCEVRCANCHALKTARERGYRKLAAAPSVMPCHHTLVASRCTNGIGDTRHDQVPRLRALESDYRVRDAFNRDRHAPSHLPFLQEPIQP